MKSNDLKMFRKLTVLLRDEHETSVFIASESLIEFLVKKGYLTETSFPDFPESELFYSLYWSEQKYFVKKVDEGIFALSSEKIFNESLIGLNTLREVKKAWKTVDLDEYLEFNKLLGIEDFTSPDYTEIAAQREAEEKSLKAQKEQSKEDKKKKKAKKEEEAVSSSSEKSTYFSGSGQEKALYWSENRVCAGDWKSPEELQDFLLFNLRAEKKKPSPKKKDTKPYPWKSVFLNELSLFSSFSAGLSKSERDTSTLPTRDALYLQRSDRSKIDLSDLLPTPLEEYKKSLSKLSREKARAKFFNPNFPLSEVRELNTSYHFWALISPRYNNVDSFVLRLKDFYSSLKPYEIDRMIERDSGKKVSLWSELNQKTGLNEYKFKDNDFKKVLNNRLDQLKEKNKELTTYLAALKTKLIEEGKQPESDLIYMQSVKEKKETLQEIENIFSVLENFSDRLDKFSSNFPNFTPYFYLSIFGSKTVLSKYSAEVGEALIDLNDQLNEIVFYQREIEKVLFEKLSTLHRARKSELKLEFLAQDRNLSKLIFRKLKSQKEINRSERLHQLELQGSLQLSKFNVQKQINDEKVKLSNYLDNLNRLDHISEYEEESRKLKEQKEEFNQKVNEYREQIYALKLKVENVEKQYSSFINSIREEVMKLQREISGAYLSHVGLINNSMDQIWADWANQGVDYIERIISRKKKLVKEFSEIIVLKLKSMYSTQDSLLEESRKRRDEWERVYREMVDEFKTLGYYLEKPKPSEYYLCYLPKMDKSHFKLSPEMKNLIYYKPSLKYTTPKVNELIGLSPRILNDDNFLVIDQVWTKLTPMQEYRLKQKLEKENQEKENIRIEEVLRKAQEDMNRKLQEKNYSFKSIDFERDFPQEADEEERYSKLKKFEKGQFHNWKETHFTSSEVRYKFKDMLTQFSKKVFTLKGVENWGENLNITDKGELEDPSLVEKLSEWDYFIKSKEKLSMIESCAVSSFKIDESDLYDIEDEGYLSVLEALEEKDEEPRRAKPLKKSVMPALEDWARLNLKRYRDEKKKIDIVEIKDGLLSLEKEIQSLQRASGNYREACEFERSRRETLSLEMQQELKEMQDWLLQQESELSEIFTQSSDIIDLSFEELGKKLDARRKRIAELKKTEEGSGS